MLVTQEVAWLRCSQYWKSPIKRQSQMATLFSTSVLLVAVSMSWCVDVGSWSAVAFLLTNQNQCRSRRASAAVAVDIEKVQETAINDENGVLSSLFGSDAARNNFFQHDIDKNTVYIKRSPNDVPPPIAGIDMLSLYESNDYISLRKRGSQDLLDRNTTSYDDFSAYIADGGSAVVPIIPGDYINSFRSQIEESLGQEVSMNVYHSGTRAVALNIHYDAYDVLVLQLQGEKEWTIQSDNFGEKLSDITEWENVTMMEGDLLYLPQGVFHAATTAEGFDTTTHVTIGLTKKKY